MRRQTTAGTGLADWDSRQRYGRPYFERSFRQAHHVSWFMESGEWPPARLVLCHHCDNTRCVRPDHLFLGTQADNLRDMFAKGRGRPGAGVYGEDKYNAILTESNVRQIRADYANGAVSTYATLGRLHGIDSSHARQVVLRLIWNRVD